MQTLGKFLQIAGLTVPPLSILAQLSGSIGAGKMLVFLVASVCAFYIGRILEGYARS